MPSNPPSPGRAATRRLHNTRSTALISRGKTLPLKGFIRVISFPQRGDWWMHNAQNLNVDNNGYVRERPLDKNIFLHLSFFWERERSVANSNAIKRSRAADWKSPLNAQCFITQLSNSSLTGEEKVESMGALNDV